MQGNVSKKEGLDFLREMVSIFQDMEDATLVYLRTYSSRSKDVVLQQISKGWQGVDIANSFNNVVDQLVRNELITNNNNLLSLTNKGYDLFDELPKRCRVKPYSYYTLKKRKGIIADNRNKWYQRNIVWLLILGWIIAFVSAWGVGKLNSSAVFVQPVRQLMVRDTVYVLDMQNGSNKPVRQSGDTIRKK